MDLNIFDVVQSIAINNLIDTQFFSSVANGALRLPSAPSPLAGNVHLRSECQALPLWTLFSFPILSWLLLSPVL